MRYKMDDGTVVDTDKATQSWSENTQWNGNNHISVNTGSQWDHEKLYRSRKGRYYVVHSSQWQGSVDHAEWISLHEAARWMTANDIDDDEIPEELKQYIDDVTE